MRHLTKWVKKNPQEFFLVLFIFALAAFLRFYKLSEYMTFLGDEGRDALIIKDLLTNGNLPFIGPPTSVGNVYLGPLYYYMMSLPMAIFWLNPVAAAGQVALIGVLTVGLVYYLARIWFGKWPAVISAFLYAVSSVTVIYSRSSWNPNPAPFFTLLAVWSFYKAHSSKNLRWLILTGALVAAAVQMHYLALILIPIFGVMWFFELRSIFWLKEKIKGFWLGSLGGVVSFIAVMSPLILFDFKHDFLNYRALTTIFTSKDSAVGASENFKFLTIYFDALIGRYLTGEVKALTMIIAILILTPIGLAVYKLVKTKQKFEWPILMLTVWLLVGLFGLSMYKQQVYDHYVGFLNPAPFLLLASVMGIILSLKNYYRWGLQILFLILVSVLVVINVKNSPIFKTPNNQLAKTQNIAKFVIAKANNQPFNFALISKSNYDAAYKFYLENYGFKPEQVEVNKTSQLFVVCEDQICQPIGHPKQEIAAFGWAKIETMEEFEGVKVFKLIANPTGEPQ